MIKFKELINLKNKDDRNLEIKKNIIFSFIMRVMSIGISILFVPLTLNYLNSTKYGIWLTLSSIVGWIGFFDIGLGNGMRNKLTEALSLNDKKRAKSIVSTTFFFLSSIVVGLFFIFIIVNNYLKWDLILNTSSTYRTELSQVVIITFLFFSIQFIFKLVGTIYIALHKPAVNELIMFLGNALSLVIIFILTTLSNSKGSLLYLALAVSLPPVIMFFVFSFLLFFKHYSFLKPSFKSIDFSIGKNITELGIKFFILQIAALISYQTSNIIIAQLFNPEEVTKFNIAYKYFNVVLMTFMIILTPFWSAFTAAYVKKDILWMKNCLKKLRILYWAFNLGLLLMLIFSNFVYKIWIGSSIQIPFSLSLSVAIYISLFMSMALYIYLLNGIGAVKLQTYNAIFEMVLNIPLSLLLGRLIGVEGVLLAMSILILIRLFWAPIQLNKIIEGKASGIWNK